MGVDTQHSDQCGVTGKVSAFTHGIIYRVARNVLRYTRRVYVTIPAGYSRPNRRYMHNDFALVIDYMTSTADRSSSEYSACWLDLGYDSRTNALNVIESLVPLNIHYLHSLIRS